MYSIKACRKCPRTKCTGFCNDMVIIEDVNEPKELHLQLKNTDYYKILNIESIFKIFENNVDKSYILYGGNTAHGNKTTLFF